ncbi:hypothetical protein G3480_01600 [Thiorhodococcus mannitoliphagus]|uniref:Uncharacterized protein n=1 Tax=Thiorhodococcus mannitoliphagus TaxID=329406 RepID=A0A6P1DQ20_9GAMM|nr:hypothetical protein [Thiorhodococcus mannitoliphagus]NEX19021.1 hypothetical protein [Thiorhodococcus mannitoliphagus]
MEYDRSFALVEAVILVGLFVWLRYLNSLGSGGHRREEAEHEADANRMDGTGKS